MKFDVFYKIDHPSAQCICIVCVIFITILSLYDYSSTRTFPLNSNPNLNDTKFCLNISTQSDYLVSRISVCVGYILKAVNFVEAAYLTGDGKLKFGVSYLHKLL